MHQPWRFAGVMPDFRYPNGRECPSARAYAYGLRWVEDCDGRVMVGHSGGLPGFGSNWTMMPEYGLAVMSFDNITYGGTSELNTAVLDTIIVLAGLEPRRLPPSAILERRRDDLVSFFPDWAGAEDSDVFAENFFLDNRLSDLVRQTREMYAEAGPIQSVGEMQALNQLRGTFVLHGERRDMAVFFTLTPEREPRIQQVRMRLVE